MKKAAFLDRDGVLNKVVFRSGVVSSPWHLQDLELEPEAPLMTQRLKELGFLNIVVSNQPDIARGNLTEASLASIHEALKNSCRLDEILFCPTSDNNDPRRKPNPGMILEAAKNFDIDLGQSFLLGDAERDILAGKAAGVKTFLIARDHNKKAQEAGLADHLIHSYSEIFKILGEKV